MASFNQITLVGNLGRDPELRHTQGGQPVCGFSLAVNEVWNDKDGNKQEKTEWFNVNVWGKPADACGKFLAKGRSAMVVGRMGSRKYNDKEGVEKTVWEVTATQVVFLGSKEDGGSGGGGGGGNRGGGGSDGGKGSSGGGGTAGGKYDPFNDGGGSDEDPVPF